MVEETFTSIKDYLLERVSSPFFGAFLSVWAIRNWEALFVAFSGLEVERKIAILNDQYLNRLTDWLTPLWLSLLLLMIYPIFSHGTKIIWHFFRIQANNFLLKRVEPSALADAKTVSELRERNKRLQVEINDLLKTESELRAIISDKTNQVMKIDPPVLRGDTEKSAEVVNEVVDSASSLLRELLRNMEPETKRSLESTHKGFLQYNSNREAFFALQKYLEDPTVNELDVEYAINLSQHHYVTNIDGRYLPTLTAFYLVDNVMKKKCNLPVFVSAQDKRSLLGQIKWEGR